MTEAVVARPIGAVAVSARSLAPDLARGAMLLLIALANAPHYRYGIHADGVRGHGGLVAARIGGGTPDRPGRVISALAVCG